MQSTFVPGLHRDLFSTRAFWLTLGMYAATLALDIATPRGIVTGVIYIALVFFARWFAYPKAALLFAAIASGLVIVGYLLEAPSDVPMWMETGNRLICIVAIWLAATAVHAASGSERRARTSEMRSKALAAIVSSSDDAILSRTLDGVILSWNRGAERLFGYSVEEAIGQHINLLVPENLRDEEDAITAQLLEGKTVAHLETMRLRKDRTPINLSLTISPVYDSEGQIIAASKIARDITETKRAEAALKDSEQRYDLIVRSMSVGLWDWKVASGALYWSQRLKEILGLSNANFVPHYLEFESRLHPDDKEKTVAALRAHLRHEGPFDIEHRLRRDDGDYIWVRAVGQALWNDAGEAERMVGSVDDITVRKRAEERFRQVVEAAPYAMLMTDGQGRIVLINNQTERLFGYTGAELLQLRVEDLLPTRFRSRHRAYRSRYFENPSPIDPEVRSMGSGRELFGLRKDGGEFPAEIGLIPLQTDDGPMVLSAVIDISERKKLEEKNRRFNEILEQQVAERTEQLEMANRELEEFAFAASHDLKAPLRVISNASQWLEEDMAPHLDDDSRANLNLLRGRVRRMERLLDDLLEYSRIGRKQDANYRETIKGDALMHDVLELVSPPAGFTVKISPAFADIDVCLMPLQQIFINLIGNAIKHHHRQTGVIEIDADDQGSAYAFSVKDDGPGISPQFHDDIFKMFVTLKPRDQMEGSGMGLAMVRKHITVCGGTLSLESREGCGSLFRFTWPKKPKLHSEAA